MEHKINIINPAPFIQEFTQMSCGEKPFAELNANDFEIPFSEIKPTDGYEIPINDETKEQFPDCCKTHKHIYKQANEWFEQFPNCCDPHRKLLQTTWFNKKNYNDVSMKIIQQFSYTTHHIIQQIEKPNWYKDITDYIDNNISGFGQLPTGYGNPVGMHIYFTHLKHWMQNTKANIPENKRKKLSEHLNLFEGYKINQTTNQTDLNILYSTYQKWLKEFPFELNSYFGNLKQHYEKQLPFLNGKPEVNKYSGLAKGKLHTKSSLIEALINLTDNLLTQINGLTLYEKGLITDANKIKLELVINSRKLKLTQGYRNSSPNEQHRYRKILKDWFDDEKRFIDEISPLLKPVQPYQTETKAEPPSVEIKPTFKTEAIQTIFDLLKDFFSTEQQTEFKKILETSSKASKKLLFKGNGNRLTDTFKKLIEHDFISGCQKQDLINWIISNFTFMHQNKVKAFVYDTVEKTISRNDYPCKSPLIEIKNGQIQKVEKPRSKKYSRY